MTRSQLAVHQQNYETAKRPAWILKAAIFQQGWNKLPFGHAGLELTEEEFELALELAQHHRPGTEVTFVRPLDVVEKEQAALRTQQEEATKKALDERAAAERKKREDEAAAAAKKDEEQPAEPASPGAEGEGR